MKKNRDLKAQILTLLVQIQKKNIIINKLERALKLKEFQDVNKSAV